MQYRVNFPYCSLCHIMVTRLLFFNTLQEYQQANIKVNNISWIIFVFHEIWNAVSVDQYHSFHTSHKSLEGSKFQYLWYPSKTKSIFRDLNKNNYFQICRFEKDKQVLTIEINNISTLLDGANQAKVCSNNKMSIDFAFYNVFPCPFYCNNNNNNIEVLWNSRSDYNIVINLNYKCYSWCTLYWSNNYNLFAWKYI